MIIIKNKIVNIIIFILVFLSTTAVIIGADAGIDENTMYSMKNLNKYDRSIREMRLLVSNMQDAVDEEQKNFDNYENNKFLNTIIEINSQIEQLKFYNGFTHVRGPGIMLSVSDSVSEDPDLGLMERIVHDVDIVVLLNDLKAAGAEAIEINGQRIINISEVVCAGPLIRVNGYVIPAPFLIRAIGDSDKLYDAVNQEGTYAYELKNTYGMEVNIRKAYNLSIPKYRGKYQIEYAQTINEEVE